MCKALSPTVGAPSCPAQKHLYCRHVALIKKLIYMLPIPLCLLAFISGAAARLPGWLPRAETHVCSALSTPPAFAGEAVHRAGPRASRGGAPLDPGCPLSTPGLSGQHRNQPRVAGLPVACGPHWSVTELACLCWKGQSSGHIMQTPGPTPSKGRWEKRKGRWLPLCGPHLHAGSAKAPPWVQRLPGWPRAWGRAAV